MSVWGGPCADKNKGGGWGGPPLPKKMSVWGEGGRRWQKWGGTLSLPKKCQSEEGRGPTNNVVRVCVKASPAEGRRRLHTNTAYAHFWAEGPKLGFWCFGVLVFWCFGVLGPPLDWHFFCGRVGSSPPIFVSAGPIHPQTDIFFLGGERRGSNHNPAYTKTRYSMSVNNFARSIIAKWTKAGPGGWGPQGMSLTSGGGPVRVRNLRVCKHLCIGGGTSRREQGELTSCRGTVQSAWQKTPVRRKGGRAGLLARVNGRHVVRGRQSSPTLEVRPGEQARLVKTVKIQVRWAAAQPGQNRGLPSVATHSRLQRATGVRFRMGIVLGRRLWGRHRLGHRPVVLLRTETAQCTVRPR